MLPLERQNAIIDYLKQNQAATVQELSEQLFIGPASIRRDLAKLERDHMLKRTYGGAVLAKRMDIEYPSRVRRLENYEQKAYIGKLAASYVTNDDVIFLDASTTTQQMISHLDDKENLIVVSNSLESASQLCRFPKCSLYICGGEVRKNSLSMAGPQSQYFIEQYRAKKLFFSCSAITPDGLLNSAQSEAELRKSMMKASKEIYLLCDSSKFGADSFYKISDLDVVDYLITDKKPSNKWMTLLESHHVQVIWE